MQVIPFDAGQPRQVLQVSLDGTIYQLRLDWNTRSEQWSISIADAAGVAVVGGVAVVADYPMLRQYRHLSLPPGLLMCVDMEGKAEDPTLSSLGGRHLLIYIPEADVAAFAAGSA